MNSHLQFSFLVLLQVLIGFFLGLVIGFNIAEDKTVINFNGGKKAVWKPKKTKKKSNNQRENI